MNAIGAWVKEGQGERPRSVPPGTSSVKEPRCQPGAQGRGLDAFVMAEPCDP
jgi:hypothetical protein